jgi:hypothetical protein
VRAALFVLLLYGEIRITLIGLSVIAIRHLLLSLVFLFTGFISFSQNMGIGVGAANQHPSAVLKLKDSVKGFLPPGMTYAQ